jgi:hypothetical protein
VAKFLDHLNLNCHQLNVTELGKYELIIMILLLVPLFVLQAHAQYDYSDIPSQEDIANMMPKEVSGTYSNDAYGVSVDFPSGWSGMMTNFKDPKTGSTITSIQVMEGGMAANMEKLEKGEFEMIMLNIVDKIDSETLPEPESPNPDNKTKCSYIFAETISFDGKKAMKLETECDGPDTSIKMRAYHYLTVDKFVMYVYATSPSSEFDNHLDTFENSVKTLSINNLVDIAYEIPDELKGNTGEMNEKETKPQTIQESSQIPDWVRGNAEWWAQGAIGDSDFVSGIQYLIKEGIMQIPETAQAETVDDSQEIPAWIKNNADWWAQGLISDDDFVKGIQYLVEQGIIAV